MTPQATHTTLNSVIRDLAFPSREIPSTAASNDAVCLAFRTPEGRLHAANELLRSGHPLTPDSIEKLLDECPTLQVIDSALPAIVTFLNEHGEVIRSIRLLEQFRVPHLAAQCAIENDESAVAEQILERHLEREPYRDDIHRRIAGLLESRGELGAATYHYAAGRWYRTAFELANGRGDERLVEHLRHLIPCEPPRGFAAAMANRPRPDIDEHNRRRELAGLPKLKPVEGPVQHFVGSRYGYIPVREAAIMGETVSETLGGSLREADRKNRLSIAKALLDSDLTFARLLAESSGLFAVAQVCADRRGDEQARRPLETLNSLRSKDSVRKERDSFLDLLRDVQARGFK